MRVWVELKDFEIFLLPVVTVWVTDSLLTETKKHMNEFARFKTRVTEPFSNSFNCFRCEFSSKLSWRLCPIT